MTQLFQNILTASFHGSIVILAVIFLRLVLKKTPKKFLCLLWLLAGIRLLMPFEIQSDLSLQPEAAPIMEQIIYEAAPITPIPESSHVQPVTEEQEAPVQNQVIEAPAATEVVSPVETVTVVETGPSIDWNAVIPYLWLAVASCFLIYTIYSYIKLKLLVQEAVKIEGGWECDRIETAFILGFIRPQIYIPMGLSRVVRKHILAHERTHLEKGDHWFKMIGFIALALHWFNPLVWIAYILLCKDIEMACDERVVQFMNLQERKEYSAALLNCSTNHAHFAACPVAFGEVSVKHRIKSVLSYKKPSFWISLLGVIAIAFVAVCLVTSPVENPSARETPLTETNSQTVKTVDELLAAIDSNTTIQLDAGSFDLTTASNYGQPSGSEYYEWATVHDGYELVLKGVENLTIRGSSKHVTTLEAIPRYASVIRLQNCTNVTLEDFTAGHTKEQGVCSGNVLDLEGCHGVNLNRLGLYGCGVVGLWADLCSDVTLADSDIYDCSSTAITLNTSKAVTISGCSIYRIGSEEYGGYAFFEANSCQNVIVDNCEISNSSVNYLMNSIGSQLIIRNNLFTNNRLRDAAFNISGDNVFLDNNQFQNNSIRQWYSDFTGIAYDGNGNALTEDYLNELYPPTIQKPTQAQLEIHVSTIDEFLAAIGPNKDIVLDAAFYDFSTATDYGTSSSEYYYWEDVYDGPGLVIRNVDNMTIRTADGNVTAHTISAVPRYADVLAFKACSNVTLSGFTAGHTKEPGSCTGGVIEFRDCDNMTVDSCGLYGCGILGVYAEDSGGIQVKNSEIYECSQGGIKLRNTKDIILENNTFRDLGGNATTFIGCTNITMDGQQLNPQYGVPNGTAGTATAAAADSEDGAALTAAVEGFASALFQGDVASMKLYLASTYNLPIEIPEEVIGSKLGAEQYFPVGYADEMETKGYCQASVFYGIPNTEIPQKMTVEMCRENGVWKVQYYTLDDTEIELLDKDLYNFTYAYLEQDLESLERFLADSYTKTPEVYFGDGSKTVADPDYSVGNTFSNAQLAGLDSYSAAIPFKESASSNSYTYLNVALQRRENKQTYTEGKYTRTESEWVVTDYGLEGSSSSGLPEGIQMEIIQGENYTGNVMLISDPSEVFLGTSTQNGFSQNIPGKRIGEMLDAYPDAVAAINAGAFFDDGTASTAVGSCPLGLVISQGKTVWNEGKQPGIDGFAGFNSKNVLVVADHNLTQAEAEALDIRDGCNIGPALIIDMEVQQDVEETNSGFNARTAIGQRADGTVILMCINGRTTESLGATYADVIKEMMHYGAVSACLMQGGSASAMMYRDDTNTPQLVSTLSTGQTQPRRLPTYWMVGTK